MNENKNKIQKVMRCSEISAEYKIYSYKCLD